MAAENMYWLYLETIIVVQSHITGLRDQNAGLEVARTAGAQGAASRPTEQLALVAAHTG